MTKAVRCSPFVVKHCLESDRPGRRLGTGGRDEDYPDAWLQETTADELRLKPTYRKNRAELVVRPHGQLQVAGAPGSCWDASSSARPGRCPCRLHVRHQQIGLGKRGRGSSATTIIVGSILPSTSIASPVSGTSIRAVNVVMIGALNAPIGECNEIGT